MELSNQLKGKAQQWLALEIDPEQYRQSGRPSLEEMYEDYPPEVVTLLKAAGGDALDAMDL
tara:strand:- start:513 stop:695 length:183 start_codon:yes stop_codon:yes gene_type:complete